MQISIIGSGYVGLTTAAILANVGYKVFAIDIDSRKIDIIKSGKSYFYEPGLDELVEKAIKSNNLVPTTSFEEAIPSSDIVFSCVGTPDNPDGSTNLEYIKSAAESLAKYAKDGVIFVQKSTVPVGTGEMLVKFIKDKNPNLKFSYASNPEFLAESTAVSDTLNPDRVVIGTEDESVANTLVEIFAKIEKESNSLRNMSMSEYSSFYTTDQEENIDFKNKVIKTTLESAELIKVTANAFLALKISFANSIAKLCDKTNADVTEVMSGIGADRRIGKSFLYAGLGWGGGCFPKDVKGLISVAQKYDVPMEIMEAAVAVNDSMSDFVISKLKKYDVKKVAVLGLSFKPGTSDVRKSPSIKLANTLVKQGYVVTAFDPQAIEEAKKDLDGKVTITESMEECVKDSEVVILATEWKDFIRADWKEIKKLMKGNIVIDSRNRLNSKVIIGYGFEYIGIGKK